MQLLKKILTMPQKELANFVKDFAKKNGWEPREYKGSAILVKSGPILLSSHLDVVGNKVPKSRDVIFNGKHIFLRKKAKTVLGGDDRCGVWLMLKLLEKKQLNYSYLFCFDEEGGCKGSSNLDPELLAPFNCFIGLDRRGGNNFALYGYDNDELNYIFVEEGWSPVMGTITDVATLSSRTGTACVNLSVGFDQEHSSREAIDIASLLNTYDLLNLPGFQEKLLAKKFEAETVGMFWGEPCVVCGGLTEDEAFGVPICEDCFWNLFSYYKDKHEEEFDRWMI